MRNARRTRSPALAANPLLVYFEPFAERQRASAPTNKNDDDDDGDAAAGAGGSTGSCMAEGERQ